MPLYDFQCPNCCYRTNTFVWSQKHEALCPHCNTEMAKLFTGTSSLLPNREKPVPFKFEPKECSADKDIWKSVIEDDKRGKLAPGELRFWKEEVSKNNPNLIL